MAEFFLNMDAVNEEAAKKASSGGGAGFFSRKDIKPNGEIEIRVLPPTRSMNGLYYFTRITTWINNKPYDSPRMFGLPDPILDRVDAIMAGTNDSLKLLVKAKDFNTSEDFVLPILLLDDSGDELVIVDDRPKVFDCTWGIIKDIRETLTSKHYQNGKPLGIFDPEDGHNFTLRKEVTADRTKYSAKPWPRPSAIDSKYYAEPLDVVEVLKKRVYDFDYLAAVAAAYFDGAPMPPEETRFASRNASGTATTQAAPVAVAAKKQHVEESKKAAPLTETQRTGGTLLDRLS